MSLIKRNSSCKMIGLVLLSGVFFLTTTQARSLTRKFRPPPTTTTPPPTCIRNGNIYNEGQQYQPSPCEWCECLHGKEQCIISDCFITECVDSIQDPTKCCPVCPNGKNCYAGNKIIPAGVDVQVDEYTTCRCPEQFDFIMNAQEAVCMSTATELS